MQGGTSKRGVPIRVKPACLLECAREKQPASRLGRPCVRIEDPKAACNAHGPRLPRSQSGLKYLDKSKDPKNPDTKVETRDAITFDAYMDQ